ncbi:MAG TPA: FeoB-associated Cys-rich membrane protein [Gemmataceae bacterium]|jgi:hypothetical protein|nr:FeoB-associated Cys-rich membrane protein [Gemmataceae bacterium]
MNIDWQLIAVLVIVAVAAAYLARMTWRSWRGSKTGCGGGCGCNTKATPIGEQNGKATLITTDQLTARLRQRS